jgi:hypothetical protein
MKDYEFYSKNLLKIRTGKGLEPFDYRNRFVQKKINDKWNELDAQGLPVMLIVLKARRHGVSTYVQSRMFHGCHTRSHMQGITIAADDEGCKYLHDMSHVYYEYLPEPLKPEIKRKSVQELVFDLPKAKMDKYGPIGLKSAMRVVSCNEKAGLGTGNHFIHFSEYAMYRDADRVRKAVVPTAFQEPGTFVVIESTANGMVGPGEPFYTEWQNAKQGKSVFTPLFYSWMDHEDYIRPRIGKISREEINKIRDTLDDEERELIDVHNVNFKQLNWRRHQIEFVGGDIENFREQYPTTDDEAFIVSGNSVFDRKVLKEYKNNVKPPIWIGDIEGKDIRERSDGLLRIWNQPLRGEHYVLAIDPASGEPGATDYGCMQVFRVLNRKEGLVGEQVAEWHGKIEAEKLGYMSTILGYYYNEALLAPEVFGFGHAVLGAINRENYANVLRRTIMDAITLQRTKRLGWVTNASTKPQMLTFGRFCVNGRMVVLKSEALVDEMIIFVRDEGGSGASAYGRGKDDRVMALLVALQAIDQEFNDGTGADSGVLDPPIDNVEKHIRLVDKLQTDDFWDKPKSTSWLDQ